MYHPTVSSPQVRGGLGVIAGAAAAVPQGPKILGRSNRPTIYFGLAQKREQPAKMLYELIAVVRPGNLSHIKDICRTTGVQILQNKGVIRGITNWGQFDLPRPTTKYQTQHHMGHYFIMQFDASAATQAEVRRSLGLDPRMIRFSVVKLGDKLGGKKGSIEEVTGHVPWQAEGIERELRNFAFSQSRGGAKPMDF